MVERLVLSRTPQEKPLDDWKSVAVELLGTQTRFIEGARWRHRVIEAGEGGEPLFLIHGVGGHAETFARNMHNLANHGFHVFAIDALYHGYSSKQPLLADTKEELEMQADALLDLVQALGIDRVNAEGESMGGMILFAFARKYPELAGNLVLNTGFYYLDLVKDDFKMNNVGGGLGELSIASVTNPTFETMRRRLEWLVTDPSRMTGEMVDIRLRMYQDAEIYRAMQHVYRVDSGGWDEATKWFTEADLRAFTPRTLVFWTDENPGHGPDYAEYCASLLPNGTFYSMKDASHWPQWERPNEHDQVLIDFMKPR